MQPLIVTAELMTGFASSDPWSPSIDGILAYRVMMERLGPEAFALSAHRSDQQEPVEGLPLAVEQWDGWRWYQCSSPIYRAHAQVTRHLHRRFDAAQAERWWGNPGKSGKVLVAAGPYKNARLPLMQHVTPAVQWAVVGERDEIERLLAQVTHIGARVGAGYGRVRRWRVEAAGVVAVELASTHRPLPEGHPDASALEGPRMVWGIRPPGRHPDNLVDCAMPDHREALYGED
jgi:CRISPR type IV-associated protein Csf3